MHFVNPIPFVSDIDRSKAFYRDVMGLKILSDFGSFVLFETGFAIHEGQALERTIWKAPTEASEPYGRRNVLLYFEDDDIDTAFERIAQHVALIHPIERQDWGQRVFRFYDPDNHAVEVGEPM
ncbi:VOC family protein [Rhizobium lusitanum]|uniref:Catechol 2,3-dioxygenase-like lactoylglutathione lyase family enzyme n=1 Tax=Rhizobium lusitanum TaxID=293958 RepID=A0A7X0MCQ6_9HYPH|nr:VOC family protein [Rhizobium lusitanum]MBB6485799.1 catechol 2,3-dioxygenase-like lactoylglutathione lyase family enzyme [Rhizobium lusitanum]